MPVLASQDSFAVAVGETFVHCKGLVSALDPAVEKRHIATSAALNNFVVAVTVAEVVAEAQN